MFKGIWNPVLNGEVCEGGEKIQRATEESESLMFFPVLLAVLIKMLMDLYCACICFDNHNAGEKSIKLECFFSSLLSCSTKVKSELLA